MFQGLGEPPSRPASEVSQHAFVLLCGTDSQVTSEPSSAQSALVTQTRVHPAPPGGVAIQTSRPLHSRSAQEYPKPTGSFPLHARRERPTETKAMMKERTDQIFIPDLGEGRPPSCANGFMTLASNLRFWALSPKLALTPFLFR